MSNIGVDIGSNIIKAVQITGGHKKTKIIHAAEVPLARGVVVAGEVKGIEDLSNALTMLWKKGNFKSRNVTLGIASEQTVTREMDIAWEQETIFRQALPLRVGDAFPFAVTDMILDYHPLALKSKGELIQQRSLVVAAQTASIEALIEAFTISKLRVKHVDFSPFALIRASVIANNLKLKKTKAPATSEPQCEVVVDIGAFMTMIAIHSNGHPLFTRLVKAGSDAGTKALAEKLQLRTEVADILKKYLGVQGIQPNQLPANISDGISMQKIAEGQQIMNFIAGHLIQEIRKSVEYYLSAASENYSVSQIVLSGGGVMIPGLAERLSSELRSPVVMLAPIAAFGSSKVKESSAKDPYMGIAFGLALEA